jgi:hypothetical protein
MIKKKIEFEKKMVILKISRFSKYIQRAIKKDLLKIRKPDFYTVTLSNSIPVTILKLKVKEAAVSILPKDIHFNSLINSNGKALAEIYAIASRRLKNEIKVRLNIEKLLTIIISIQIKDVTVRNLIANYSHIYKTFFGKTILENRKEKKDSIIINSMRTGVSAKAVSL